MLVLVLLVIFMGAVFRFSWSSGPLERRYADISSALIFFLALRTVIKAGFATGLFYYLPLFSFMIYTWRYLLLYKPKKEALKKEEMGPAFLNDFLADLQQNIENWVERVREGKVPEAFREGRERIEKTVSHAIRKTQTGAISPSKEEGESPFPSQMFQAYQTSRDSTAAEDRAHSNGRSAGSPRENEESKRSPFRKTRRKGLVKRYKGYDKGTFNQPLLIFATLFLSICIGLFLYDRLVSSWLPDWIAAFLK